MEIDYQKYQTIEEQRLFYDKYCVTCNIIRPPTTSHCSYCNVCVFGYDHHCYIFGNCIGIRNWRNFIFALFFIILTACYLLTLNTYILIELTTHNQSFQNYFSADSEYTIAIYILTGSSLLTCICCCN